MRRIVVVLAVWALLLGGMPVPVSASSYGSDMGWGLMAFGSTLVYIPAKLCYAILGGVTGGLAYGLTFGNLDTAKAIWSPALGGTYVLSPGMVRGKEPILFSGESYEGARPEAAELERAGAGWNGPHSTGRTSDE